LRELAAKLALGDTVHFVARVPHEDVPRYYEAADLCVFPRRRMRLTELVTPLKPLEVMAQRKPVAASDVGGHRELVRHNETGYLFPADDARALAQAIAAIAADPAAAARLAAKGREFVEMHRTWTAVSARYAEVYETLLGNAGA
jgi:glycogen synthase